jgi:hypothetical protein
LRDQCRAFGFHGLELIEDGQLSAKVGNTRLQFFGAALFVLHPGLQLSQTSAQLSQTSII